MGNIAAVAVFSDLNELIQTQVGTYVAENPERLRLKGRPVRLPSSVATPFGLVLHELATNAAKYGAFSADKGEVELSWTVAEGNENPVLKVTWQERHGPAVKPPKSKGFGSRLIETGLTGASVQHEFPADGVKCMMEIPLDERSDDAANE